MRRKGLSVGFRRVASVAGDDTPGPPRKTADHRAGEALLFGAAVADVLIVRAPSNSQSAPETAMTFASQRLKVLNLAAVAFDLTGEVIGVALDSDRVFWAHKPAI